MDDQIVSKVVMFYRGAEAARRGKKRDDHGMNAQAPAVVDWQAGHDYVTKTREKHGAGKAIGGQP